MRSGILSVFFSVILFYSCNNIQMVDVETAKSDSVKIFREYTGQIKAYKNVEVHARVVGFLERMTFDEGSKVSVGDPLFYINNSLYKAGVAKAKAQLIKDQAQAAKAERDVERLTPLYAQNAASQLDLDNAVAAYNMANASVAMSKADLQQAELELSYTVVRSPLTGYIGERYADVGALVGSPASLLATVVQIDTVFVDFKLTAREYLENQRRNVHLGTLNTEEQMERQTITITLADSTIYKEKGIVDFAAVQIDPETGTFSVRAQIPNPNLDLLPGQFTNVTLLLDMLENAIIVTKSAVLTDENGYYVFVVKADNTLEKRWIETGFTRGNEIIVSRGLEEGETVVTKNQNKLYDGQKIRY